MNLSTLLKSSGLISSDRVLKRQYLWYLLCLVCGSTRAHEFGIALRRAPNKIEALTATLSTAEGEALTAYFVPVEWFTQNRDRVAQALPLSHKGITYQPGSSMVIDGYIRRAEAIKPALFDAYLRVPISAIAYAVVVKESRGAIAHCCHAVGCQVKVPPKFLMCPQHWRKVPKGLQSQVWDHYRPGQEIDKQPTAEYLKAAQDAIAAVAAKENAA